MHRSVRPARFLRRGIATNRELPCCCPQLIVSPWHVGRHHAGGAAFATEFGRTNLVERIWWNNEGSRVGDNMMIHSVAVFGLLVSLVVTPAMSAKGDMVLIEVKGGTLAEPIKIADPRISEFNVWAGAGVN